MQVQKHLSRLGMRCKDKITGFTGVITHVGFDLYGCIQVIVHPGLDKDNKPLETAWFDINRLEIVSDAPVMNPPNFEFGTVAEGRQGAGEKPLNNKF